MMNNDDSVGNVLDNSFDYQLNFFNNAIDHFDDETVTLLADLFSIHKKDVTSQRNHIKNFISSELNLQNRLIKNDFLDIFENLDIIQNQIKPKNMINLRFNKRSFYIIQATDQEQEDILINLSSLDLNETIFLQIIPDGLLNFPDFQISENEKTIDHNKLINNSYLRLRNKSERIQLTFRNFPQNLFFVQVLFYKKMTNNELFQLFRDKLNVPKNISNLELKICHNNHSFEFIKLIDSIQRNNSIICPICNKETEFLYYDSKSNEKLLDYIIDDNDIELIDSLSSTSENDHSYISKYQVPKILRNQPSLLSLCAFFRSKKCFFSLLKFYLERNEHIKINKKDNNQRSPIHFACFGGDLQIIQELIKNNEILNCNDCEGFQPIHYAAMGGNFEVITFLYQNELNMFPCANSDSLTPLHLACQFGYYNIVRFYCEIIIPCNEIGNLTRFISRYCKNKITPLHVACKHGQERIVNYFLSAEKFAKCQIDFNTNKSPLVCACESDSLNCVKALLNARSIFVPNEQQIVKSFNAAVLAGNLDILTFLFKKFQIKISSIMILASIANNHYDVSNFLIQNALLKNESCLQMIESLSKNESNSENLSNSSTCNDNANIESESDVIIGNDFPNNNEPIEEVNGRVEVNDNQQTQNRNPINFTPMNQMPIPLISTSIHHQQQQNESVSHAIRNTQTTQNQAPQIYQRQVQQVAPPVAQNATQNNQQHVTNVFQPATQQRAPHIAPIIAQNSTQTIQPAAQPAQQSAPHIAPIIAQNVAQPAQQSAPHIAPIIAQNVAQPTQQSAPHIAPIIAQNVAQPTQQHALQIAPIIAQNVAQQRAPHIAPIIAQNSTQIVRPPAPVLVNANQNEPRLVLNQAQLIGQRIDPSAIGYDEHHDVGAPSTFADLAKLRFRSKIKVKTAVQNISMIEKKNVHIVKSESRRIVFKCISECKFSMTWKERDGFWCVPDECFENHTCTAEDAKEPKFTFNMIDYAIDSMSLTNFDLNTGVNALSNLFGEKCSRRKLKSRLMLKKNGKKV